MWKGFVVFYWQLFNSRVWQPDWMQCSEPDEQHFHRRRFTRKYRRKLAIVRGLWSVVTIIWLLFPLAHIVVFVGLSATFMSFSILDETP